VELLKFVSKVGEIEVYYLTSAQIPEFAECFKSPYGAFVFGTSAILEPFEIELLIKLVQQTQLVDLGAAGPGNTHVEQIVDDAYIDLSLSGRPHPMFNDWDFSRDVLTTYCVSLTKEGFESALLTGWGTSIRLASCLVCIDFGQSSVDVSTLIQWRTALEYLS
jgi:hypothetical protein